MACAAVIDFHNRSANYLPHRLSKLQILSGLTELNRNLRGFEARRMSVRSSARVFFSPNSSLARELRVYILNEMDTVT